MRKQKNKKKYKSPKLRYRGRFISKEQQIYIKSLKIKGRGKNKKIQSILADLNSVYTNELFPIQRQYWNAVPSISSGGKIEIIDFNKDVIYSGISVPRAIKSMFVLNRYIDEVRTLAENQKRKISIYPTIGFIFYKKKNPKGEMYTIKTKIDYSLIEFNGADSLKYRNIIIKLYNSDI